MKYSKRSYKNFTSDFNSVKRTEANGWEMSNKAKFVYAQDVAMYLGNRQDRCIFMWWKEDKPYECALNLVDLNIKSSNISDIGLDQDKNELIYVPDNKVVGKANEFAEENIDYFMMDALKDGYVIGYKDGYQVNQAAADKAGLDTDDEYEFD